METINYFAYHTNKIKIKNYHYLRFSNKLIKLKAEIKVTYSLSNKFI